MSYCYKCGADVKDGYKFCSSCGAPANVSVTPPEEPSAEEPEVQKQPDPVIVEEAKSSPVKAKAGTADKPVGAWGYFGLILLFCFPLIGIIPLIIMSFAAKRSGVRNFARGSLIYFIVSTILTVLFIILLVALITPVINYIRAYIMGITAGATGDILAFVFEVIYYIGSLFGYYSPMS